MYGLHPDRFPLLLAAALFLLLGISFIHAPYPFDTMLQHVPTLAIVIGLCVTRRWFPFSRLSYVFIFLFLILHVIGARYVYSYVPYDAWMRRLVGFSVDESLGLTRNHYDRLVHLAYGLLLANPLRELICHTVNPPGAWSYYFAIESIMASSVAYELVEWLVAITFAPDWADRYLGQQGDIWDGQKDMACATLGAVVSMALAAWRRNSMDLRTRP